MPLASERRGGEGTLDLALLTDGLRAEREQGITIDVAYRYFATAKRRFIIADCPGHHQYTRNMVTGASTADVSVVLLDARRGVLEQSKRHAFISALLGIPHMIVAINKMDLVDYSQERFEELVEEFEGFAAKLSRGPGKLSAGSEHASPRPDMTYIPISALNGDNVVERSELMPWYDGPAPAARSARAGRRRLRPPLRQAGALSRAVGHPPLRRDRGERERLPATTADTPASWQAARCGAARRSRSFRVEAARGSPRSTPTTASSRRRWPRCR